MFYLKKNFDHNLAYRARLFINTILLVFAALVGCCFFITNANARSADLNSESDSLPIAVKMHVNNPKLVGKDRFIYWMFKVYDAYLYAPDGKYTNEPPFALSLRYLRSFTKEELVKRTFKEMGEQGFSDEGKIEAWNKTLMKIFINVNKGDYIIAIAMDNGDTAFFNDVKELGYVSDPDFRKPFFDIWLGAKSSEPGLRKKLLNLK